MDLKKQFTIINIIILLSVIIFSGCNDLDENRESNRFIGYWYLQSGGLNYSLGKSVKFNSDGTLSNDTIVATYEIKDGKLVVTVGDFARMYIFDYSFSEDDYVLTLTNIEYGETKLYIKE